MTNFSFFQLCNRQVKVSTEFTTEFVTVIFKCHKHEQVRMTSSPSQLPPRLRDDPYVVSAYNICLKLERSFQEPLMEGRTLRKTSFTFEFSGILYIMCPQIEDWEHWYMRSSRAQTILLSLKLESYIIIIILGRVRSQVYSFNVPSDTVTQSEQIRVEHQYPPIMHLVPRLIRWQIWLMIP